MRPWQTVVVALMQRDTVCELVAMREGFKILRRTEHLVSSDQEGIERASAVFTRHSDFYHILRLYCVVFEMKEEIS
jgi:hypothetical protein